MKNILITGQFGVTGVYTSNYLKRKGFKVYGFSTDTDLPEQIDVILHIAAKHPSSSAEDITNSNIVLSQEILKIAIQKSVSRIIFFSSVSVYGKQNHNIIDEQSASFEPDLYGISKLYGERLFLGSGIKTLVIRLPAILDTPTPHLFNRSFQKLLRGDTIQLLNGEKKFNFFISLSELARFLSSNMDFSQNECINFASSAQYSLLEIMNSIKKMILSKSSIVNQVSLVSFPTILDIDKLVDGYGFTPKDPLFLFQEWVSSCTKNQKSLDP